MKVLYELANVRRTVRCLPVLRSLGGLRDALSPGCERTLGLVGTGGLVRHMNGSDEIYLHPDCRVLEETCEPEVWAAVMKCVEPGDAVVDVGGHRGLHAVAFDLCGGPTGHVLMAKPDPANLRPLRTNIDLNDQPVVSVSRYGHVIATSP